ncbi:MAG TPA: host-nuclease inhibitor Gam family protein [Acidimicrobiales bacterium]|nr:host-nuclease inhibitor Gam family protein [Acidimicrobiales bacterium]
MDDPEDLLDWPEDYADWGENGPPDQDNADRLLRGLRAVTRRRDEFLDVANRRRAELDARIAEVVGPLDQQVADITFQLEQYHAAVLSVAPSQTTVKLPHGTLRARAGGVSWEIEDEEALRAWLKENWPALLEPQEPPKAKLNRNEMKTALKEGAVVDRKKGGQVPRDEEGTVVDPKTGEVVPGLRIVAKDTGFFID